MTMLCLLLSCTTPNPVEEAKVEMQKEYHAYFDNTISMIEQYNWCYPLTFMIIGIRKELPLLILSMIWKLEYKDAGDYLKKFPPLI